MQPGSPTGQQLPPLGSLPNVTHVLFFKYEAISLGHVSTVGGRLKHGLRKGKEKEHYGMVG